MNKCECSGTCTADPVDEVLSRWDRDESALIGVLQDIQSTVGYLPKDGLHRVAEHLDVPLSRVFHVATFYTAFSLTPRGRHHICVCTGTACHVRGAAQLASKLSETLSVKAGETTSDGKFTLDTVHCLGCCSLGPVMIIDDQTYGRVNVYEIDKILDEYK